MRNAAPIPVNERVRQHRARQRNGVVVAPVLVNEDTISVLIRLHWLSERDSTNTRKVAAAVSAMIADASSRFMRLVLESGPRWRQ
jgi:hypothetical protein